MWIKRKKRENTILRLKEHATRKTQELNKKSITTKEKKKRSRRRMNKSKEPVKWANLARRGFVLCNEKVFQLVIINVFFIYLLIFIYILFFPSVFIYCFVRLHYMELAFWRTLAILLKIFAEKNLLISIPAWPIPSLREEDYLWRHRYEL